MHLVYVDDSGDRTSNAFSAILIDERHWLNTFNAIKAFRAGLKKTDGIDVQKEFHATDFVAGRGNLGPGFVTKSRRCAIFNEALTLLASLPGVQVMNAFFPVNQDSRAFERLLTRIQRNMEGLDSRALLICDQGKEARYTLIRRRLAVHNPIPSNKGFWPDGKPVKNIAIERVIEDLIFKDSKHSSLTQMADFCAYALVRFMNPLPSKSAYGLDRSFLLLDEVLVKKANGNDPRKLGIIQP